MPFAVSAGGVRIHYEIVLPKSGVAKRDVVLIQGLGLSSRFWFDQSELLSDDSRVILLDNRGTGQSDRPRGPYRLPAMADDVAAVMDACAVKSAIVVGISMGGMIAQHVAMRYPKRVSGLVLMATAPGHPWSILPKMSTIATLLSAPLQRGKTSRRYNRLLLPECELDRANEHLARWPAALEIDPISTKTFLRQFFGVMTNWTGGRHAHIECPAVVITGADDILIPPENSARLAKRIPRSHLQILPDVAHAVPLLRPNVVRGALEKLEEMGA
ncbi:alpha/beta hydrolase [soil metagenome]